MHDCVSGFVSQHIKSIILSKQVCKRQGKEEREQKDIILLTITRYCLLSACATESRIVLGTDARRTVGNGTV